MKKDTENCNQKMISDLNSSINSSLEPENNLFLPNPFSCSSIEPSAISYSEEIAFIRRFF